MTSDQVLAKAAQTQVKTTNALDRTIAVVEETKNVEQIPKKLIILERSNNCRKIITTNIATSKGRRRS
jgi:hypothetical protein